MLDTEIDSQRVSPDPDRIFYAERENAVAVVHVVVVAAALSS